MVEELLQLLVGEVNTQLLETVVLIMGSGMRRGGQHLKQVHFVLFG